jgi:hypothetical protein
MAIYHFSAQIISRSSGRSSIAAAAYRACISITDERTGQTHDYSRKKGADHSEIFAPENSPEWITSRSTLWNAVERAEKRKDAQLCREIEISLPFELKPYAMRALVAAYVQSQFVQNGMVADVAIHHAKSDNPHAHILLTTRAIYSDGFGQKNRDWNKKELLETWRASWEHHANKALELAGLEARIDHRSLEAQGINRIPQIHIGPHVVEIEAKGIQTERGYRALEIEQANEKITALSNQLEKTTHERDYAITPSQKRRTTGERDRTISPELSDTFGRSTADLGRDQQDDAGAWRTVQQPDRDSTPELGRRSIESPESSRQPEQGRGEDGMDSLLFVRGDWNNFSDARDRIVSLASVTQCAGAEHDGHEGRSGTPETGHSRISKAHENTMTPPDRTYLAVRRHLEAMHCDHYEIGIRDRDGKMLIRNWSQDETLKSVAWLKRENAKGADIYVRPAGDKNQGLILVDDLNQATIARMKHDDYAPAAVVETSPLNYQAWVRLTNEPLAPELATAVSKAMAKRCAEVIDEFALTAHRLRSGFGRGSTHPAQIRNPPEGGGF